MKKRFKKVYIEITNCCNFNCNFCPKTKRTPGFISIDQFKLVLQQITPYTDYIYLHLMGEPLLHPNLPELLTAAAMQGLKVNITTNGSLLAKQEETLIRATALRQVNISVHSFDANEGEFILSDYINQVLDFVIKAKTSSDIITSLRFWNLDECVRENQQNSLIFQLIEQRLQMSNSIRDLLKSSLQLKLSDQVYLNMAKKFDWPMEDGESIGEQTFCYALRDQIGILVDGTVVPCCLDHEGSLGLGNLYEQSFDDIIQGSRALKIYEGFSRRIAVEELCKRCGYATRFHKDKKPSL